MLIISVRDGTTCGPRRIKYPVPDGRVNTAPRSFTRLMRLVTTCNPVLDIPGHADSIAGKFTREMNDTGDFAGRRVCGDAS
jgi:hypothetical protein